MPRAGDDIVAVDLALAERAGLVQAQVVDREELIAETKEGNMAAVHGHHLALACFEIADASNRLKVAHRYLRAAGVRVVSRRSLPRM